MPAFWMAVTKGDEATVPVLWRSRGSFAGTVSPMTKMPATIVQCRKERREMGYAPTTQKKTRFGVRGARLLSAKRVLYQLGGSHSERLRVLRGSFSG